MVKSAPPPQFKYCSLCILLSEITHREPVCPIQNNGAFTDAQIADLRGLTPSDRWLTPEETGEEFSYSTKQIIRIAGNPKNEVAAYKIDNRWFISFCSMHEHMEKLNKLKPKE